MQLIKRNRENIWGYPELDLEQIRLMVLTYSTAYIMKKIGNEIKKHDKEIHVKQKGDFNSHLGKVYKHLLDVCYRYQIPVILEVGRKFILEFKQDIEKLSTIADVVLYLKEITNTDLKLNGVITMIELKDTDIADIESIFSYCKDNNINALRINRETNKITDKQLFSLYLKYNLTEKIDSLKTIEVIENQMTIADVIKEEN